MASEQMVKTQEEIKQTEARLAALVRQRGDVNEYLSDPARAVHKEVQTAASEALASLDVQIAAVQAELYALNRRLELETIRYKSGKDPEQNWQDTPSGRLAL